MPDDSEVGTATSHGANAAEPVPPSPALSRRAVLGWLGGAAVGASLGAGGLQLVGRTARDETTSDLHPSTQDDLVEFFGPHQAGITTPPPAALVFAAFDVTSSHRSDLRRLLRIWTEAAARMTRGEPVPGSVADPDRPPVDTGETRGLSPSRLTVTFGFGPGLFVRDGHDRFGLAASRPASLRDLPPFRNDVLDPARSGGDLCIQACSEDGLVAFHAVHDLAKLAKGVAGMRWLQRGFGQASAVGAHQPTPRNLMGFKDGTNNIREDDLEALDRFVWVQEGPAWMHGGTFLVARRIRIHIERWDASDLSEQQDVIGRYKASGAPLGLRHEFDPVPLNRHGVVGHPTIPARAHIRLAAPSSNEGQRILRRGYSFVDGVDAPEGRLDLGLFFLAFQRDPFRQFVPINRRLARSDALNEYILHTSSAVFAIPGGLRPGEAIGEGLL
jgi:deferrochelatase/peroxidase EfeB